MLRTPAKKKSHVGYVALPDREDDDDDDDDDVGSKCQGPAARDENDSVNLLPPKQRIRAGKTPEGKGLHEPDGFKTSIFNNARPKEPRTSNASELSLRQPEAAPTNSHATYTTNTPKKDECSRHDNTVTFDEKATLLEELNNVLLAVRDWVPAEETASSPPHPMVDLLEKKNRTAPNGWLRHVLFERKGGMKINNADETSFFSQFFSGIHQCAHDELVIVMATAWGCETRKMRKYLPPPVQDPVLSLASYQTTRSIALDQASSHSSVPKTSLATVPRAPLIETTSAEMVAVDEKAKLLEELKNLNLAVRDWVPAEETASSSPHPMVEFLKTTNQTARRGWLRRVLFKSGSGQTSNDETAFFCQFFSDIHQCAHGELVIVLATAWGCLTKTMRKHLPPPVQNPILFPASFQHGHSVALDQASSHSTVLKTWTATVPRAPLIETTSAETVACATKPPSEADTGPTVRIDSVEGATKPPTEADTEPTVRIDSVVGVDDLIARVLESEDEDDIMVLLPKSIIRAKLEDIASIQSFLTSSEFQQGLQKLREGQKCLGLTTIAKQVIDTINPTNQDFVTLNARDSRGRTVESDYLKMPRFTDSVSSKSLKNRECILEAVTKRVNTPDDDVLRNVVRKQGYVMLPEDAFVF